MKGKSNLYITENDYYIREPLWYIQSTLQKYVRVQEKTKNIKTGDGRPGEVFSKCCLLGPTGGEAFQFNCKRNFIRAYFIRVPVEPWRYHETWRVGEMPREKRERKRTTRAARERLHHGKNQVFILYREIIFLTSRRTLPRVSSVPEKYRNLDFAKLAKRASYKSNQSSYSEITLR